MSVQFKNGVHVCICCLSRDSPLISLTNCKHATFLPNLFENTLDFKGTCVCRICHSTIKKIDNFVRQVEGSYKKLNNMSRNILTKHNRLATSNVEINSTIKGRPIKFEVKNQIADQSETQKVTSTLKVEQDSDSELDSTLPLTRSERRKKENKKVEERLIEFEVKNIIVDQPKPVELSTTMKVEHDSDSEIESALPLARLERRKKENKKVEVPVVEIKVKDQEKTQELDTTLKEENESDSETDSLLPLARLERRKKENTKANNRKNTPKMDSTTAKYDGKIKMVTLTLDQMMEERSVEAAKKSYQNLPFKCENCIIAYDHEVTLKVHIEQKHMKREGGFECNICKSILSTERSYKEHTTRHVKRYECVACGKRNNNIHPVIKHYNEQHGNITTNFTCSECGFSTDTYSRYKYHRLTHKAKVVCKECGSTFAHPSGLRAHMLTVHALSDRTFSCGTCNKRFKAKSSLASHVARHAASPLAYCAPCASHYSTPMGLRHHLRTHSRHVSESDKRFICDECGSKFSTKWSLEEHIDWVHLKKIKHECSKCKKGFKNNAALKKHMNYVHEKKRPPRNKMCDHCGRGFTTMSILRSHVRTHTGERPLICSHCNATFAHPAALYTHTKLLHGKS